MSTLIAIQPVGDDPDVYLLSSPLLPGLMTFGRGARDTIAAARSSVGLLLAHYRSRQWPVPAPGVPAPPAPIDRDRDKPFIVVEVMEGGQFLLTSPFIDDLITYGRGMDDALQSLTRALDLLLVADSDRVHPLVFSIVGPDRP
jgi:predicted RNase H-like HicB family nuclease